MVSATPTLFTGSCRHRYSMSHVVKRGEGLISHLGAVAAKTGHYTGQAAKEKFIVDEPATLLVGIFKEKFRKYAPNVTADVANVL